MTSSRNLALTTRRSSTRLASSRSAAAAKDDNNEDSDPVSPKKKTNKKRKLRADQKTVQKRSEDDTNEDDDDDDGAKKKAAHKKTKKAPHQQITERDELPKLWDAQQALEERGSYTFKIISWNVAGLRAVLKNHPEALPNLATTHNADVICLQETKLQEMHVDDPKLKIRGFLLEEQGYDAYYDCSTAKKGYSGTAVFVKRRRAGEGEQNNGGVGGKQKQQASMTQFFTATKKKKTDETTTTTTTSTLSPPTPPSPFDADLSPHRVSYGIGDHAKHNAEGRAITVDFPLFSLTNLYVPNAGQKLERLDYRTEEWDTDLVTVLDDDDAKQQDKPVVWLGDLNVAHRALDVWNDGAAHLAKQAGTTAQERESFQRQLDRGYVDAFRHLHPTARGQYSYWSQRAGNRTPNKGLRLDYFVCRKDLVTTDDGRVKVRDCYMLPEQMGSDHCPVVLELEVKKKK